MARSDKSNTSRASDSSKKVARAAKVGQSAGSTGRERRELGFPMALAGVFVAGLALVAFSWNARDAQALTPSFDDHWHIAYGIYDCRTESFLPNLADPQTPNSGIHTHGDGVVHLHPRSSDATGKNAQLKRFLEATRTDISGDAVLSFPDREALDEDGAECDGEPAVLQVVRFDPGSDVIESRLTEDLIDYRFQQDQERVVIALAPLGADVPPPPQENIDSAAASSPFVLQTDGLDGVDLDGTDSSGDIGIDEDGNLVDGDGNILVPADELEDGADDGDGGDDSDGDDGSGSTDDGEEPAGEDG